MDDRSKKQGRRSDTFERKVFRASRLADFATIDELIKQTGQPVENWPLVVVKELVDNALDEAEKAGIAPEIEIVVTANSITVADQGRGIAPATVKSLVDYAFRMSSNAAYVSPTRGQQGNALQILFAMPYVLNGKRGRGPDREPEASPTPSASPSTRCATRRSSAAPLRRQR